MLSVSTSNRPYHHGDLRTALLDAADAMLDEGGDGAVSLREAARRAGVSPTAAYRHFADKNALLAALMARHFAEFGKALAGRPLAAMGPAYVRFALARPGRFRLMFGPLLREAQKDPGLRAASGAAFQALLRAAPDQAAALRAWGMVHGLAHLLLDGVIPDVEDADALVARVLARPG
jgi:AcrR family transcriptional regulator